MRRCIYSFWMLWHSWRIWKVLGHISYNSDLLHAYWSDNQKKIFRVCLSRAYRISLSVLWTLYAKLAPLLGCFSDYSGLLRHNRAYWQKEQKTPQIQDQSRRQLRLKLLFNPDACLSCRQNNKRLYLRRENFQDMIAVHQRRRLISWLESYSSAYVLKTNIPVYELPQSSDSTKRGCFLIYQLIASNRFNSETAVQENEPSVSIAPTRLILL